MNRIFKKLLASIMVAVMVMCAVPSGGIDFGSVFVSRAGAKDLSSYSVGDTITYGSYPQSKVTDSSLISALETAGNKYAWVSYNYYSGTGYWDDGQMKPDEDMMWYKDIPYNGDKYRAVWLKKYRPYSTGYASSVSGSEQVNNGYHIGNVYYFKYEPLKWRVLDPSEGFVMCTTSIDAQAYNNYIVYSGSEYYGNPAKTYYASDWANSSIRAWLNDDFYNTAFSDAEKSQIGTTYNENKSRYLSKYDSADTSDKIFLLSYNEARNLFHATKQLISTDYAKCQGCSQITEMNYSWWRLRSPFESYNAVNIYYGGDEYYNYSVNETGGGIVPAFKFISKPAIPETEKLGDINGDTLINSVDALLVLQHTVKQLTLTKDQQKLADVNKDTFVNSNDALWILEYAVGKRNTF